MKCSFKSLFSELFEKICEFKMIVNENQNIILGELFI